MHFIDGNWTKDSGHFFQSTNPATGEVIWQGVEARFSTIDDAVKSARFRLRSWQQLAIKDRLVYLRRFTELLSKEKTDTALLISKETGKPLWECEQEVDCAVGKLKHSENAYEERCSERYEKLSTVESITRFRPIGVIAVIGPFNFPLHLPNGQIIPALLAGNTIVFKPSEQTPATAQRIMRLWQETGLPAGVINMVHGGAHTGEDLIFHKFINGVFFTGSYQTARHIHHSLAGEMEKMVVLEAGGNNPLIADGSGDLESVCHLIAQSAFLTAGQRCVCARRLIVPYGEKGDRLIDYFVRYCDGIRWAAPSSTPQPFMGTLINSKAADLVEEYYTKFRELGAKVLVPLKRHSEIRALISPCILDVSEIKERLDLEVFGPLLQVIRCVNMKAAFAEAEATRYGLSAGILTEDESLYREYLNQCSAGVVNWNRQTTGALGSAPFGGRGCSGNYRPGGYLAADFCCVPVASLESDKLSGIEVPPGVESGERNDA